MEGEPHQAGFVVDLEQRPDLHGWVYGLKDGIIKPVYDMKAGTPIDDLYEYDDL